VKASYRWLAVISVQAILKWSERVADESKRKLLEEI